MEEIRQLFAEKNFDDRVMQLLSNFIEEFEDLFGKYLSREELIRRIKENLENVEFVQGFEKEKTLGIYSTVKRKIQLKDLNDEEEIRSVFFHEMIHCITTDRNADRSGFMTKYEDVNSDEKNMITIGRGFNEGVTQYITQKRNKKYAPNLEGISYPILSEQTANIVDLVGEEKFLDITFNRPDELQTIFDTETIVILQEFDVIWQEEENIYIAKERNDIDILAAILGYSYMEPKRLKIAKSIIIGALNELLLAKKIETINDFVFVYQSICKYANQLATDVTANSLESLFMHLPTLQDKHGGFEETLKEMPAELQSAIRCREIANRFCELDKEKKLEFLVKRNIFKEMIEAGFDEINFGYDYLERMGDSVIQTNSQGDTVFRILSHGLAKRIMDRGYNVDTLSIEFIDFGDMCDIDVFNLYTQKEDGPIYLGTFIEDSYFPEILEPSKCSEEEYETIIEKYPQLSEALILRTTEGHIITYNGDNKYNLVLDGVVVLESEEILYSPSLLERIQERINRRMIALNNLRDLDAPQIIIKNEEKVIQELLQQLEQIRSRTKIIPEEINQVTAKISLEELEQIMQDIADGERKRKISLERGMGHGE